MKSWITGFLDGALSIFHRNKGFLLGLVLLNGLTQSILLVMHYKNDVMFCYLAGVMLFSFIATAIVDRLPKAIQRLLKPIVLVILAIPFLIELFVVYNYQAMIGAGVVASILETNMKESVEFIKMYSGPKELISIAGILVVIGILTKFKPWNRIHLSQGIQRKMMAVVFIFSVIYTARVGIEYPDLTGDPMVPVYRLGVASGTAIDNIRAYHQLANEIDTNINITKNNGKAKNVVFILGESTNRNHMHLYGYYVPNTPNLDELKDKGEIAVFTNAVSPHSTTIAVLSKMLTFCNHESDKPWYNYHNVVDVMNAAGYKTHWLSNQESSGIWGNVAQIYSNHSQVSHYTQIRDSREDQGRLDEELMPLLDNALYERSNDKNFIVLHLMGGHGLYYNRYPYLFHKFTEKDINLDVSDDKKLVVAEYDNALLYNDYVVSNIIGRIRDLGEDSIVIYLPDHGEAVFDENSSFAGHIEENPSRHMIEVPLIIWASDQYKAKYPERWAQIQAAVDNPYMTDDMIHTILDLAGVETDEFDKTRSVINPEFNKLRPRIFDDLNYDTQILTGTAEVEQAKKVDMDGSSN